MDFSTSPDVDARICYLVVFVCGLISARIQIYKRLSQLNITGIWMVSSTWLIFSIYLLIPLLMFWLMDRLSAIHDTSLFAALLIGFAYPAVLAGGFGGLKPPEGVSGVLKPIEAFTDTVAKSVVARAAKNDRSFEQFMVGRMRSDKKLFDYLKNLALNEAMGAADLTRKLDEIDARAAQTPDVDPVVVVNQKARLLYLYITSIPDYLSVLSRDRNVFPRFGWGSFREWLKSPINGTRGTVILGCFVIAIVLSGVMGVVARSSQRIQYHAWRLAKPNQTELDRFRSREALRDFLKDTATCSQARSVIARTLRSPGLGVERADAVLQLLLQTRAGHTNCQPNLPELLITALRVDNVDKRSRIHHALVLLARERDGQFASNHVSLVAWTPNKEGESVTVLEDWIQQWTGFWQRNP